MWDQADMPSYEAEVNKKINEDLLEHFDPLDTDKNYKTLTHILSTAKENHVPSKTTSTRFNLPWYEQKLRRYGKQKQRLYNVAAKSKKPADIAKFKKCRRDFKILLRAARKNYLIEKLQSKLDKTQRTCLDT